MAVATPKVQQTHKITMKRLKPPPSSLSLLLRLTPMPLFLRLSVPSPPKAAGLTCGPRASSLELLESPSFPPTLAKSSSMGPELPLDPELNLRGRGIRSQVGRRFERELLKKARLLWFRWKFLAPRPHSGETDWSGSSSFIF